MMTGKSVKDIDRYQAVLTSLLSLEDNKFCADCKAKGPRWASWNLGIFVCIRCAGIHRNLGVHISRVKSVNLDQWTQEQIQCVQEMGNAKARRLYEAFLPECFQRPESDQSVELFIRDKYDKKKYMDKVIDIQRLKKEKSCDNIPKEPVVFKKMKPKRDEPQQPKNSPKTQSQSVSDLLGLDTPAPSAAVSNGRCVPAERLSPAVGVPALPHSYTPAVGVPALPHSYTPAVGVSALPHSYTPAVGVPALPHSYTPAVGVPALPHSYTPAVGVSALPHSYTPAVGVSALPHSYTPAVGVPALPHSYTPAVGVPALPHSYTPAVGVSALPHSYTSLDLFSPLPAPASSSTTPVSSSMPRGRVAASVPENLSLFLDPAPRPEEGTKRLSKDSILSLYGSTPSVHANSMAAAHAGRYVNPPQMGYTTSPYGPYHPLAAQGGGMGGAMMTSQMMGPQQNGMMGHQQNGIMGAQGVVAQAGGVAASAYMAGMPQGMLGAQQNCMTGQPQNSMMGGVGHVHGGQQAQQLQWNIAQMTQHMAGMNFYGASGMMGYGAQHMGGPAAPGSAHMMGAQHVWK